MQQQIIPRNVFAHVPDNNGIGKQVIIVNPYQYDLVIHCGGCMLNRQQMISRIVDLLAANVVQGLQQVGGELNSIFLGCSCR